MRRSETDDAAEERFDDPVLDDEDERGEYDPYPDAERDTGTWWDEGLITLLIVAGAILFVFPEPATSGLGVILLAVGILAWALDLVYPDD
ncbi:MAG: hypothetical protein ABEJ26_05085 [Halosimplex sp.]